MDEESPPMRKLMSLSVVAVALAAAGCQSAGPGPQARVQPRGVEGQWVSSDGVAFSNFNAGSFETIAADTGNKLADGSYTHTGDKTVSITVNSLIRQTTTQVNCALVSPTQLNSTSASGQQFSLVRRVTS